MCQRETKVRVDLTSTGVHRSLKSLGAQINLGFQKEYRDSIMNTLFLPLSTMIMLFLPLIFTIYRIKVEAVVPKSKRKVKN